MTEIRALLDVPFVCMDVANGYSEHFVQAVRRYVFSTHPPTHPPKPCTLYTILFLSPTQPWLTVARSNRLVLLHRTHPPTHPPTHTSTREAHPTATIIAGNVVTGEMVEELLLSGADVVKVGIGPG